MKEDIPVNGDPYVYYAQVWLNNTYGDDSRFNTIPENGKTGWTTIYALIRALQIELGIQSTADNFGNGTINAFNKKYPSGIHQQKNDDELSDNVYGIIQCALVCKGYNYGTNSPTCHFYNGTGSAIKQLKADAGLEDSSSTVTINIMKALLSMDYFKSYDNSEKTQKMIKIQRYLNHNYEKYIGIRSCDGVYGRRTNQALIYAIQAEEGMPISIANGNFGPSTKRLCPTIPYNGVEVNYYGNKYSLGSISAFNNLFKISLFVNEIGDGVLDGTLDQSLIKKFQKKYSLPVTGTVDLTTWLSAFISCGDVNRSAKACDCATILTKEKAELLYSKGYRYVGRYLSGYIGNGQSKALTLDEINNIFNAGLRIFPIYQTSGNKVSYFTEEQAQEDIENAISYANSLNIPPGTVIYFAVDCDPQGTDIKNNIIPYFKSLNNIMHEKDYDKTYKIGIYGTRNTCQQVSNKGYAICSFVSDMSTGFSGNLGYVIPDNWAFDQFATITVNNDSESIEIDKDAFSGRDEGFGNISIERAYNNLVKLYNYILNNISNGNINDANLKTLTYLRHVKGKEYNKIHFKILGGNLIGNAWWSDIDQKIILSENDFKFYDPKEGMEYDTLHMAATLNCLLCDVIDPELVNYHELTDDYAGWAGDMITYANYIKKFNLNQEESDRNICNANVKSDFEFVDYIADIDAIMIYKLIKNGNLSITDAFYKYFISATCCDDYLSKRTINFVNANYAYQELIKKCNDIMLSTYEPYNSFRDFLLDDGVESAECEMAMISFLRYVQKKFIEEKINN